MTFPNYLLQLNNEYDLYSCFIIAAVGLIGAFLMGYGTAIAVRVR